MTTDWFRIPQVTSREKENPFERFGLSRNPFPNKPSLPSLHIGAERLPYSTELRVEEERKFEKLMIPNSERSATRLIAFLMDFATRRGRGIGKTAFLAHQRDRIMQDLGSSLTDGNYVLFATYVLPMPGKTRKFWQFARLIAEALGEQNVIAIAMWRLRAFSGVIPAKVLERTANKPEETVGSDSWLREQGIDVDFELAHSVSAMLEKAEVRPEVAEALARYGHDPVAWSRNYLAHQSDFRWQKEGLELVFDDLVRLFAVAGFSKGLLLIDEVEKIVTEQNIRERRAFADLLRYYFIDGPCENTRRDFYSLFLTIHPYLQELLVPHWEAAGLDRFAALGREFSQEYTVYFGPLNRELAEPLVKVYLNDFRLREDQKGTLLPFDRAAIEEALVRSGGVPGKMLTLLYHVMERAAREGWDSIGAAQVRQVIQAQPPEEPEEDMIGVTSLPPAHADLKGGG